MKPLFTIWLRDFEMRVVDDPGFAPVTGYHVWGNAPTPPWVWEENFQTEAERKAFMKGLTAGAMHFGGRIRVVERGGEVNWMWGAPEEGDPSPTPMEDPDQMTLEDVPHMVGEED